MSTANTDDFVSQMTAGIEAAVGRACGLIDRQVATIAQLKAERSELLNLAREAVQLTRRSGDETVRVWSAFAQDTIDGIVKGEPRTEAQ